MSDGYNRVTLLGNLGFDPELRTTPGGSAVLKLRVATSERYKDNQGAWQERTEWHRVTVWGKRAEALHRFLRKGSRIFVEGSLRTSSYEKEGQKHYTTEVNAREVLLCDDHQQGRQDNGESRRGDDDDFSYGGNTDNGIPF